jgi:signal transduction histidine kinase
MESTPGEGPKRVRALIVEDSDDDAWLLTRELQRAGWVVDSLRIESADELRTALVERVWDVVIADFRLPHFSAREALAILKETGRDIPFIVVSGAVGEEVAVELMRSGAHDYVPKTSLARLGPAVSRELQEATVRQARRAEADAQRIFAEAGAALGVSLHYEDTLRTAACLGVPDFADTCGLEIHEPDGTVRRLGELADAVDAEANAEELSAPLMVRGALLGTLRYTRTPPARPFELADVAIATELAHRVAVAIDNARLFEAEQTAREQAQAAVRARDEFLSVASHELRTPVTAIRGGVQVLLRRLRRGELGAERLESSLTMLDQASFRLTRLTEDLLDVTRLQTGLLNLVREDVDPGALAESIVNQYRDHLPDHLTLRVAIEPSCHILADATRLEQVLINLLTNAVKYSPDAGSIDLRVHATDDGAQIDLQDAGIGLLPDRLEHIFEPFARGPGASARQIPGMGLGLHISRQIVEQHGGRIWATSAGEGLGSTFSVWLPCAPPPDG